VPTIQTFDSEPRKTFADVDANSNAVSILINHDPRSGAGVAAKALLSNPINLDSFPFKTNLERVSNRFDASSAKPHEAQAREGSSDSRVRVRCAARPSVSASARSFRGGGSK
jgi:hypothetical protein